MSSREHGYIEQDKAQPSSNDDLPTYDDLAAQNGPNSRFGRWKGWIEKRAAERYNDLTPQERQRRRERGWGNEEEEGLYNDARAGGVASLQIQTSDLSLNDGASQSTLVDQSLTSQLLPLPFVSQRLTPSHLKINHFGSRFLPHATSPIRCILPLLSDKLLLVGHEEGLSVLDMFPQEWTESGGLNVKTPEEAQAWPIWRGEGVYQMSVLEVEETRDDTPQGVVLMLIGPEPESSSSKDCESMRVLRMYNLGSLTSLARWAVAHKGARPLDLHRPSNWQVQQTTPKKHRPQSSFTRSLKSLIDTPGANQTPEPNTPSYHNLLSASPTVTFNGRNTPSPVRGSPIVRQDSDESGWDVVEDLPLRWATDFVPLATSGSRLANTSILSYALWSDENRRGRGGKLLAVATKYNIFVYETPKGERAFRFVKEFYTPLHPRSITFFQQSVQDVVTRSVSDVTPGRFQSHKRSDSAQTLRAVDSRSPAGTVSYGTQLSLFVIFDKKAGWIRLADAAVGEVDLFDDRVDAQSNSHVREHLSVAIGSGSLRNKARMSFDIYNLSSKWTPPARCAVPAPEQPDGSRNIHLLTRGKKTHILPSPVPSQFNLYPPLHVVHWRSFPRNVVARVCTHAKSNDGEEKPPFLQLVAFGEGGLEVQELSLSFLVRGKGKGKAIFEEPVRVEEDLGGDVGFLCTGGHWDKVQRFLGPDGLKRSYSAASDTSGYSFESLESHEVANKMKREEGMYGWCRKGAADWRVFWVGGLPSADDDGDSTSSVEGF